MKVADRSAKARAGSATAAEDEKKPRRVSAEVRKAGGIRAAVSSVRVRRNAARTNRPLLRKRQAVASIPHGRREQARCARVARTGPSAPPARNGPKGPSALTSRARKEVRSNTPRAVAAVGAAAASGVLVAPTGKAPGMPAPKQGQSARQSRIGQEGLRLGKMPLPLRAM